MILQRLQLEHPRDTGYEINIPRSLKAKEDLEGLQSLVLCVDGAIPAYLPVTLLFTKRLQIDKLTIHYSGTSTNQTALMEKARDVLYDTFDAFDQWHASCSLKQFTLSWDFRPGKETSELTGNMYELSPTAKAEFRRQGPTAVRTVRRWPVIVSATSKTDNWVGFWRLNVGARCAPATRGLQKLLADVFLGRVDGIGARSVASEVTVQYEPREGNFIRGAN